jgi:hypothetical protein
MRATSSNVIPFPIGRKGPDADKRPTEDHLVGQAQEAFAELIAYVVTESSESSFGAVEDGLKPRLFALARLLLALFLCVRERQQSATLGPLVELGGKTFERRPAQARSLNTMFGVIRYWRTYLRGPKVGGVRQGHHPLDAQLGLFAERMSFNLASLGARLATKLSFAQTRCVLGWFIAQPPSTEVIEHAVLGLGRHTHAWQQQAPAPDDDGDVLVIQIDGKAAPTATEQELTRRRGKRRVSAQPKSARHRGRHKRKRYGAKPRRAKGDKSKNGKVATVVVMYTLKRSGQNLLGPINRLVFASFRPKRAAFKLAQAEAAKRGFGPDSGKRVQLVTDGDDDLALYAKEYLPQAEHTLDVMHVTEYLWKAGRVLHREGSAALSEWVGTQKDALYRGKISDVLRAMRRQIDQLPSTAGVKSRRTRLEKIYSYLDKRQKNMDYARLIAEDMEIGSGSVEGAVNHVVGKRFDQGGMRWIKGRAEALLQLRCIEINGYWKPFTRYVYDTLHKAGAEQGIRPQMLSNEPIKLDLEAEAA